jgi:hypothetical protein
LVAGFLGGGAWTLSGFFGSNVAYVELPEEVDEAEVAEQAPQSTRAAEPLMRQLPPVPVTLPPPVAVMPKELTAH